MRNGTWQTFKPAARDVISAIAHQLGVASAYSVGLVFQDDRARERIAECAGISETSTYQTFIQLIAAGAMRGQGKRFEIIMPPEPFDWNPAIELSLANENEAPQRAPTTEILFPNENREEVEPLQDTDLRAPTTEILFPNENSVVGARQNSASKIAKSDSCFAVPEARAGNNGTEFALSLAKLNKAKLELREPGKEKLKEGRSVARILIEDGGFCEHNAQRLAKKPNATFRQVIGSIRLCNSAEQEFKEGRRKRPVGNREAFVTKAINEMWEVPPDEVEQALENLPEHQQEEIQPALEAELAKNPAAKIETAVLLLAKPVKNDRIAAMATRVCSEAPDAELDVQASRRAAEASRVKFLRQARSEAESLAASKARLSNLGPEKLAHLADVAIAAAIDPARSSWTRRRSDPLSSPSLMAAIEEILGWMTL
jgi:hypothetical protein